MWSDDPVPTRTAMVTGASVGLGRAIATGLGELGWRVAIGARRRDRLEETAAAVEQAGGAVFSHELDVTDADSVARCFDAAEAALGPIEVLVNNAGMTTPGPLAALGPAEVRRVFETNTLGAIFCTQEVVRRWQRDGRSDGHLVFISSETADRPWPQNLPYGASKAAIEHIARGLRIELDETGNRISIVQLGPAISEFGYGWDPERMEGSLRAWNEARVWTHPGVMTAEEVARGVVLAITSPRGVEVHDLVIKPTHTPLEG
jgi:NAD(P)-dependent dehydrogenase (short-subunit alcohol dehydrogenase family)